MRVVTVETAQEMADAVWSAAADATSPCSRPQSPTSGPRDGRGEAQAGRWATSDSARTDPGHSCRCRLHGTPTFPRWLRGRDRIARWSRRQGTPQGRRPPRRQRRLTPRLRIWHLHERGHSDHPRRRGKRLALAHQRRGCRAPLGSGASDAHRAGRLSLIRVAQVVPELPTFAVDDGFAYRIPDTLGEVSVGSVVRVPLGGRRVRGYVVDLREVEPGGRPLKDIMAVSGDYTVFDARLLQTLRWSAMHYVAPLGAVLGRAAPPNLPRRRVGEDFPAVEQVPSPLPAVADALERGARIRPQYLIGTGPWVDTTVAVVAASAAADRSAMVVSAHRGRSRSRCGSLDGRIRRAGCLRHFVAPAPRYHEVVGQGPHPPWHDRRGNPGGGVVARGGAGSRALSWKRDAVR